MQAPLKDRWTQTKMEEARTDKYFSYQEHTWLKPLMGRTKYEQLYLLVNKENLVLEHLQLSLTEMSIGYSSAAADWTFYKLHLFQYIFHFCGSQTLWIDITIMEFSFWLPAVHMQQVQYIARMDLTSK